MSDNFCTKLFEKFGIITAVILSVMQLAGYVINMGIPTDVFLISLLILPLRWTYLYRMSDISKNFARFYLWAGWDLSMVAMPILMFNEYSLNIFTSMSGERFLYRPDDVAFCIKTGALALSICFFTSVWWKNTKEPNFDYFPNLSKGQVIVFTIIGTGVITSAITVAKLLGIGEFGQASIALPMKLTGVITYLAFGFFGFFELFVLDAMLKKGIPFIVPFSIIIVISLFSAFASLSKSALISPVSLLILYCIITKRFDAPKMVFIVAAFLAAFVLSSFLSAYRNSRSTIYSKGFGAEGADYSAIMFVHRIFSDGGTIMKIHSVMSLDDIKSNLQDYGYNPRLINTYLIDKTPSSSMHSSGCTTLAGSYMFGYTVMGIIVAFLSLVSVWIDYRLPRAKGILAASAFRTYIIFFFATLFLPKLIINVFMDVFVSAYSPEAIFMILTLLCYIIYVKLCCQKAQISNSINII